MTDVKLAVINRSSSLSQDEVSAAADALQEQITRHFAPIWGTSAEVTVAKMSRNAPLTAWHVVLVDDPEHAAALGIGDRTAAALPLLKVFVEHEQPSWTVAASHEILETLADPHLDTTVFVETRDHHGRLWPLEVCDPVASDSYWMDGVEVSNFVTPEWFRLEAATDSRFDFLRRLTAPFEIAPGGYMDYYDVRGGSGWNQLKAA